MTLLFFSAMALGFSGAMMPGPLLTYTIKQSLRVGMMAGIIVIFGHMILEILLIGLIFLGFDVILQSELTQLLIALIGGALLTYMGLDMIIGAAKNKVKIDLNQEQSNNGSMVFSGFLLSAINPYFLIWWAIIGLGFLLEAYKAYGTKGVILFYAGHVSADFIWYGIIGLLIGTTKKFLPQNLYRVILAILGLMLIYFGFSFILGSSLFH